MKPTLTYLGLAGSATLAVAALVGCGGGGGGGGGSAGLAPPSTGTLAVALTDAPACGFDAVNVTVSKVRVHQSSGAAEGDAGWTDITLAPARKIDLLKLTNGVLESLGQTALAPGRYTQLRLVLDANSGNGIANSVVVSGSAGEKPLETPSAVQSGIKLTGQFDVAAGQKTDVVLDFDACKSVVTRGKTNYALKPVLKVIPAALNGISGVVDSAALAANVMVSAQQNGVVVSSTTPDRSTGEFILARLPAGNYDVVITADNRAAHVVGAVPVGASAITPLATSAAPIAMAASTMGSIGGTATLTPPSATEAVYVSARQSFAAGPTVVVKYQGADIATGAYTIANLPLAAPRYVAYSATLPLTFAAAATVTPGVGKYAVEAGAAGYATKSIGAVDLSVGNPTGINFGLVP